jgi:hypothetical protein
MNRIDHPLLDQYVSVKGELEKLPSASAFDPELWEIVDQLLLDLHMIRHGYTTEGYEKFVDRRLKEVSADATVETRMRELRL